MATDFNTIFDQLKDGISNLAKSTVSNYVNDATSDATQLLNQMKADLQRWTLQLETGGLTTQDFEWLVNSQKGTLQMAALQKAGLAAIRIDQFKSSVFNLIVDTIFKIIL